MALGIYTNLYSTIAQNNLTTANNGLAKSIERLSSGLRINHAADDASGLAISEKLRGQIRGFSKAYMNAQDAISFLQTAEGGMEVVADMLQRMRELAVQAGNGTYTTNDRAELQKEVTQLKEEINRVASSTEYNTKKLLTGDAAALWSTDSPKNLSAIVRGAPQEGNYKFTLEASGGRNYVYKTNEMTVINSSTGVTYNSSYTLSRNVTNASFKSNEEFKDFTVQVQTASAETSIASAAVVIGQSKSAVTGDVSIADAGTTGYLELEAIEDANLSGGKNLGSKLVAVFYDALTGEKRNISITEDSVAGKFTVVGVGKLDMTALTNASNFKTGSKLLIAVTQGGKIDDTKAAVKIGTGPAVIVSEVSGKVFNVTYDDKSNIIKGEFTYGIKYGADLTTDILVSQGAKNAEIGRSITTTNVNIKEGATAEYKVNNVKIVKGDTIVASAKLIGKTFSDDFSSTIAGTPLKTGYYAVKVKTDKPTLASDFEITYYDQNGKANSVEGTVDAATDPTKPKLTFEGVEVVFDATKNYAGTFLVGATAAGDVPTTEAQVQVGANGPIYSTLGGKITFTDISLDTVSGAIHKNKISFEVDTVPSTSVSFNFDRVIINGGVDKAKDLIAKGSTKLKNISSFLNKDGRNALANTQKLTIFGNGQITEIFVEGDDTIDDLADKLTQAIIKLGMGTGDPAVDANLVKYVNRDDIMTDSMYSTPGTFVFQSGLIGDTSKISIIGDESMMSALGIAEIQSGYNSEVKVTVEDAHTGTLIGKDTISDNTLRGIIKNIDVKFKDFDFDVTIDRKTGKASFTHSSDKNMFLHVVDNRTDVQIGANQGQTFDISIGQMDIYALEIDEAFVITMEESQKAITKFDQALEKVNSARASIGAHINRLEYTMKNLGVAKQNLVAAESRIRDLDVADESSIFSRNQILVNSAIAMLAQANQMPQMALQLISGR